MSKHSRGFFLIIFHSNGFRDPFTNIPWQTLIHDRILPKPNKYPA